MLDQCGYDKYGLLEKQAQIGRSNTRVANIQPILLFICFDVKLFALMLEY